MRRRSSNQEVKDRVGRAGERSFHPAPLARSCDPPGRQESSSKQRWSRDRPDEAGPERPQAVCIWTVVFFIKIKNNKPFSFTLFHKSCLMVQTIESVLDKGSEERFEISPGSL